MKRSILVPVDGSSLSETAIPVACAIARRQGRAPVEVVCAYAPPVEVLRGPGAPVTDTRLDHDLAAHARDYVAMLARRLSREGGDLQVRAIALEGDAAEAIVARVREANHDLVVMTTHGRSGPSRYWLGSVADRVARVCPVPVLMLRDVSSAVPLMGDPAFPEVLVPVDVDHLAERLVPDAMALAGAGATLHLAHVVVPIRLVPPPSVFDVAVSEVEAQLPADLLGVNRESAQRHLDQVAEQLRTQGMRVQTHVVIHPSPATAILELAHEVNAKLIAMAPHGRRGMERLFLGSVSDKVLRTSPVPVLLHRTG